MNSDKNFYPLIIIGLFSLFIVLMIITLALQNIKQPKTTPPSPTPTIVLPTTNPRAKTRLTPLPTIDLTLTPISSSTPTPIPPTFTGARNEKIPQKIIDYTKQKTSLMQNLPLKTTDFTIDFDYNEGKFIVKLNQPKQESQKKFEEWLKNNYPSIPQDQFVFQ